MRLSSSLRTALTVAVIATMASVLSPHKLRAQAHEAWNEAELVVRPPKGPAMWRIKKGASEVWVIGTLPVFPKKQKWSSFGFQRVLKGARQLITPAQVNAGPFELISMMRNKNLPDKQTLKSVLPADLYAHYLQTAQRAGVNVKDFERDKPVWAIGRFRREVLQKQRLDEKEPARTMADLARKQGVEVRTISRVKAMTYYKPLNEMAMSGHINCLRHGLADIEFDLDRAPRAAQAWAIGDLRTVHANYQGSTLMACLSGSNKASDMLDDSVEDAVEAIAGALKTPGKSVAIVSLSSLLRNDGVLERLRAQGLSVTSPDV